MTPAVLTPAQRDHVHRRTRALAPDEPRWSPEPPRPEPTLEDLLASTWDGLQRGEAAACPVCKTPMRPRWSAGAGVVGGRCESCGSELS